MIFESTINLGNLLTIAGILLAAIGGYFRTQAAVTAIMKKQAEHDAFIRELFATQRTLSEAVVRVSTLVDEMRRTDKG